MGLSQKRQDELRERAEQANKEHTQSRADSHVKKKTTRNVAIGVGAVLVLAIGAYTVFAMSQPGYYDDFAKCLNEQGAVMYGASFCQYSKTQLGMFGKSYKHLDYKDFTEGENIKITPTWEIDGERFENVQSLDRLASLTGCSLT